MIIPPVEARKAGGRWIIAPYTPILSSTGAGVNFSEESGSGTEPQPYEGLDMRAMRVCHAVGGEGAMEGVRVAHVGLHLDRAVADGEAVG